MPESRFSPSGELVYATRAIDEETVRRARRLAYNDGRVIEHDHRCVLCFGVAATIALPDGISDLDALRQVLAKLQAIRPDVGEPTHRAVPLAIGALRFVPNAAGQLAIPSIVIDDAHDGEPYGLVVGPKDELEELWASEPFVEDTASSIEQTPEAPDSFSLVSVRSHRNFRERVGSAVEAIRGGELDKVVLAREILVTANRPFVQSQLLERMRVLYPSCTSFAIDGFIGASPELLCRRKDNVVTAHPLAGTIPRSGDPEDDSRRAEALLGSDKERKEHDFVVQAIVEQLQAISIDPVETDGPHLMELRNVAHLATTVHANLATNGGYTPSAIDIVGLLHPTPAVGGVPREAALSYIDKFEDLDRDLFAGPVGFVDAHGDGEWWLGLRSAMISGHQARLLAGVGIVASSEPEAELIETQLKLQALLATAVRP